MAEFALPKNSRIKPGRTWPAPSGAKKTKRFRIYRYEPESGQNPRMATCWCRRAGIGMSHCIHHAAAPEPGDVR